MSCKHLSPKEKQLMEREFALLKNGGFISQASLVELASQLKLGGKKKVFKSF
jgi:hypothetical protein